jgi:hypothetical protein
MNAQAPLIHLCLVSERPLANLIPVLQFRPDYVALGVTATMRRKAEDFRRLLVSLGYAVERVMEFEVPEQGIEPIREAALSIEAELQDRLPGCRVAYNATGGTKLMALGFSELLGGGGNQVFYTDTARELIEFVYPRQASEAMRSVLGIEVYLRAHGKQLRRAVSDDPEWRQRAQARKSLSKWLAANAEGLDSFFGALNALALGALDRNRRRGAPPSVAHPRQGFRDKPRGLWLEAMERIKAASCCQWDGSQPLEVFFHDAEGAEFLAGRWLEEYVWHVVADAGPEEVKAGAEFTDMAHAREEVRNELDCVAAHRNRLLLIECKTGRMGQDGERDSGIVYKLDSIAHDMGLFQQRLLVSARLLDEATRARAQAGEIGIVEVAGLKRLREAVAQWMENRR